MGGMKTTQDTFRSGVRHFTNGPLEKLEAKMITSALSLMY